MATRPAALAPRAIGVAVVLLFATATFTFAASQRSAAPAPAPAAAPPATPKLVVPGVTGQAYVFAKGVLEDAGFAWRLAPGSKGYAASRVVAQYPKRGVEIVNTGAPTLVLKLAAPAKFHAGLRTPDQGSPYAGTALRLADAPATPKKPKPAPRPAAKPTPKPAPKPAAKPSPAKMSVPARPPAFTAAGAKKEPLDEMPLPARAHLLATWVDGHGDASSSNVNHWLYQHAWITTGAKFGWWHGAEALRILVAVDRVVERQWGMGATSEAEARDALSFVEARSK